MWRGIVAALSVGMLLSGAARAESKEPPDPRHALGVGVGLRGDAVREDLVVPLAFTGPGFRLLAAYRGHLGPGVLSARANVGLAFLWNRFGHMGATLDYGAEAAWTARFFRGLGWHLSLGPVLALDSRVNFLFSWDDAHGYWLGAQWLGPMLRYVRRLGTNWRIESDASMALLGFEGRPPVYRKNKQDALNHVDYYFTRPQWNERFVTLADLQVLRIDAAVRKAAYREGDVGSEIGRGWAFGVDLRLARTSVAAINVNLSACLYAARAWGW